MILNKQLSFLILIISVLLSSCKGDSVSNISEDLIGAWSRIDVSGSSEVPHPSYMFKKDNTLRIISCDIMPDCLEVYSYEMNEAATIISFNGTSYSIIKYEDSILELGQSNLVEIVLQKVN